MEVTKSSMELDVRDNVQLVTALINSDIIINKSYLSCLSELEPIDLDETIANSNIGNVARCFRISKLIHDKNEDSLDKLISVINAVGIAGGSIATIIKSDGNETEYYLCVINKSNQNETATYGGILEGTFKGNFNGSNLKNLNRSEIRGLVDEIFDEEEEKKIVSSISGVGALRNSKKGDGEKYIQGLEKFVESVRGKEFTAILLGDPVSKVEIDNVRTGYEGLYSQIMPFVNTNLTINDSDTLSFTEGVSESISNSINSSISLTNSKSETSGWSKSHNESVVKKSAMGAMLPIVGAAGGLLLGSIGEKAAKGAAETIVKVAGDLVEAGVGMAVGKALTDVVAPDKTISDSTSESGSTSKSNSKSRTEGTSSSTSNSTNLSESNSTTRGRSIQIKYENKRVKSLLEKIDVQLKRLNSCEDFGGFTFSAYVVSNSKQVNNSVACAYNSLMRGESSSVEASVINTWESEKVNSYLSKFTHPVFNLKECGLNEQFVTPTSIVSGKELAIHMALPKKSIVGLPVIETASFGRNIFKLNGKNDERESIEIGNIYHMGETYENRLNLDVKSLAMHTFVTGSTGAGKSNTIYKILEELNNNGIKFLVVEPAKGEYKNVFGHRSDVNVYGTNPKKNKLLRINPFAFNDDIHILEHIDRLIEIFNVCWPMYAAMPAVLKEAVEEAYKASGWDLNTSENILEVDLFPSFEDVLDQLNIVINKSAFSDELKGNYIGSLVTRVKSLTNGINGLIFSNNDISDTELFDENVVVDLSRVGSTETKSLIMGLLIMKLQEYRMAQGGMNIPLKHVTVLEEAHNILKRTSTEQSSEGSNMLGKSVEMLSNAIAEIRTFGEGFIIADQSPGMLDMSAIRNTNTKIVMRLPEQSDRELVGKAIGLSKDKIEELSKLETGVAAIYQNDWIEAVLCKVDRAEVSEELFVEKEDSKSIAANSSLIKDISKVLINKIIDIPIEGSLDELGNRILKSNFIASNKIELIKLINFNEKLALTDACGAISRIYNSELSFKYANEYRKLDKWQKTFVDNLSPEISELDTSYQKIIVQCILKENAMKYEEAKEFYSEWSNYIRG